jgi:phosphohistidine phosphatase
MPNTRFRRLYIVRHGEAKPKDEDPERGLTEAGHAKVSRMANWVAASGIRVGEIRHGGKLRAQQTAEIFAGALGAHAHTTPGLAPRDDCASIARAIASEDGEIMMVGHLPFLERLAALLTVGNADSNVVTLGAGALLELTLADDAWRVTCLMQPRLLPGT